jgi:hypothetical protein
MRLSRRFALLLLAAASFAVFSFAQKEAKAQVVVVNGYGGYGGYYAGYGVFGGPAYGAPIYSAPVYAAPIYTSSFYSGPVYNGYAVPAPIAVGGYAPYGPVAPLALYPNNDIEINHKYENGLWTIDIDD